MKGINKVTLIGNLGKDPEVRYLEDGTAIAKFPLATTESYKNKAGEKVESTEWHNIVLWRGLAEIAEKYLTKGKAIYLEGKIKSRSWEDKEGNKRYITEINGDNLLMLDKGGNQSSAPSTFGSEPKQEAENPKTVTEPVSSSSDSAEDDLPF
ncbi:MAG: single-stranded DNA-binding protein [Bacteroidia bacterium]|nr:single-stranded DNA-binding protein [Bacteroidia bacterium]